MDELGVAHERLLGEPATEGVTEIVEVFGASAGAALYRRAMLDDVGGFDESFFAYLEDADLAWRARMRGWRVSMRRRSRAVTTIPRRSGHRSADKYFLVGRNRVRMLAKNATGSQLLTRALAIAGYDLAYVAYAAATAHTLAPLRGRLSGLRQWHLYRRAGQPYRRTAALTRTAGLRRGAPSRPCVSPQLRASPYVGLDGMDYPLATVDVRIEERLIWGNDRGQELRHVDATVEGPDGELTHEDAPARG